MEPLQNIIDVINNIKSPLSRANPSFPTRPTSRINTKTVTPINKNAEKKPFPVSSHRKLMSVTKLIEFETNPNPQPPLQIELFTPKKVLNQIDLLSQDKDFFAKKRSASKVEHQKNSTQKFGDYGLRVRCNSFSPELRTGYKNNFLRLGGEKGRVSGEKGRVSGEKFIEGE